MCEELGHFSKRVLWNQNTASHTKVKKCVDNEGDFVEKII
jgi:hypothetical protein